METGEKRKNEIEIKNAMGGTKRDRVEEISKTNRQKNIIIKDIN